MGFWGIEVEPGKPYLYKVQRKLQVTRATLGTGVWKKSERIIVQCSLGHHVTRPIFLCSFSKNKKESCSLNLEFEIDDGLVAFSVIGNRSVHLSGNHFVATDIKGKVAVMEDQIKPSLPSRVNSLPNGLTSKHLPMGKTNGKRDCTVNEGMMERSYCETDRRVRSKIGSDQSSDNLIRVRRSWNEMPHNILVNIMQRLQWVDWRKLLIRCLCRSWLSALVDAAIPPNGVLDLREFDLLTDSNLGCYSSKMSIFLNFLKFALENRPNSAWTTIYFPNKTRLRYLVLTYIAERTPLLRELIVPKELRYYMCYDFKRILEVIPYWKNLKAAQVSASELPALVDNCKFVCRLSMYGPISDRAAVKIAEGFPLLKYLVIPSCTLSVNALGVILKGHKNLEMLDTQHSYCVENADILKRRYWPPSSESKASWEEETVDQMAADAGVKLHLQCARKHCLKCGHLYTASGVSSKTQRPW